jgi:hypothetical protein
VIDVAVIGLDIVEQCPAARKQRTQLSGGGLLTISAGAPILDVSGRGVEQDHGGGRTGAEPDADPERAVARVGEKRDR